MSANLNPSSILETLVQQHTLQLVKPRHNTSGEHNQPTQPHAANTYSQVQSQWRNMIFQRLLYGSTKQEPNVPTSHGQDSKCEDQDLRDNTCYEELRMK